MYSWENVYGCDTFVVLPPATANGCVIFGKNSDRPSAEVQELFYAPRQDFPAGQRVHCTFIEIDQVEHTNAVILSKPSWMWGAEMGANEQGVVIGNEAVWTHLNGPDDHTERLLGMDLVRLGLERANTAEQAVRVMAELLEVYGQGGPCSEDEPSMTYHNSFLIADRTEAWVLETADRLWAAERITSGCRNISNCLSIGTNFDLSSEDLLECAQKLNLYKKESREFNFAKVFSDAGSCPRYKHGARLLSRLAGSNAFSAKHMMQVLRDKDSGICMELGGSFVSTSSQVSILPPVQSALPCVHFFTATPDPACSMFKPFVFDCRLTAQQLSKVASPRYAEDEDPAKLWPRFKKRIDRRHLLYSAHEKAFSSKEYDSTYLSKVQIAMQKCEDEIMDEVLAKFKEGKAFENDYNIFTDAVEREMALYNSTCC